VEPKGLTDADMDELVALLRTWVHRGAPVEVLAGSVLAAIDVVIRESGNKPSSEPASIASGDQQAVFGEGLSFEVVRDGAALVTGSPALVGALASVGPLVEQALDDARAEMSNELHGALMRVLTRTLVDQPFTERQAAFLAQAQMDVANEFGLYRASEIADRAGSTAENRSALASRWEGAGQIVSVPWQGGRAYAGFQFDPSKDWRPRPIIAEVISLLRRSGMSEWETVLWFTTRLGALGDLRPADCLLDPGTVLAAATSEAAQPEW
jgi:hypothetical protein